MPDSVRQGKMRRLNLGHGEIYWETSYPACFSALADDFVPLLLNGVFHLNLSLILSFIGELHKFLSNLVKTQQYRSND
jgi:hypothetical protein